jgi:hypothetical protein
MFPDAHYSKLLKSARVGSSPNHIGERWHNAPAIDPSVYRVRYHFDSVRRNSDMRVPRFAVLHQRII